MIVEPNCRYGHGPLVRVPVARDAYWGLYGVRRVQAEVGAFVAGQPLASLEANHAVFTLLAFRCPTCGYMELFDEGFTGE